MDRCAALGNRHHWLAFVVAGFVLSCNSLSGDKSSSENSSGMKDSTIVQKVTSKDGTIIAFWKSGSGPPLLVIHGTTADHTRWAGILPRLEQHFTVYAMDRRGRGESTDAPEYAIAREAEDIVAVLDHVGERAFVLGHSYGAVCALEAALLTDRIARLILYEPPLPTDVPMYPPGLTDKMQVMIDSGASESALELFVREVLKMPEADFAKYRTSPTWPVRVKLAPTIPREIAIDRTYHFDPARFAEFRVPTLLLLGGESPALFRRATEVLDSALTTATLVSLPGQQHIAMDTNPDLFLSEVLKFLR